MSEDERAEMEAVLAPIRELLERILTVVERHELEIMYQRNNPPATLKKQEAGCTDAETSAQP